MCQNWHTQTEIQIAKCVQGQGVMLGNPWIFMCTQSSPKGNVLLYKALKDLLRVADNFPSAQVANYLH